MRILVALLIFFSLAFAECEGEISQYVPAVVGNGGGMVNITIRLAPGSGEVFSTVDPNLGIMTQDSLTEAIAYARSMSGNTQQCDMLITFATDPKAEFLDGPSAGAALTVMSYALLENKTLRNDAIITGSIERDGSVGPVGGLYEKAKQAAERNAGYFITPTENFYEMLLLNSLEQDYDIEILEAENVEEIIGFMTENKAIEQKELDVRKREIPELEPYNSTSTGSFRKVAQRMIELEENELMLIDGSTETNAQIAEFFENEFERQQHILEQGYLFSAANEAFLNYIEISTIVGVLDNNIDLPRKKGEVGICLTSLKRPQMTDRNFEWVVGADLRKGWAFDKINQTVVEEDTLTDEKYSKYNQLMYARAWCKVAEELINATPVEGEPLDEQLWNELAMHYLNQAYETGTTSAETTERLRIAERAYRQGSYGAAIFDSIYVAEMEKANSEIVLPQEELEKKTGRLIAKEPTSLWGKIYHSQGVFLKSQNQTAGAYRVLMLAGALDSAAKEMKEAAKKGTAGKDGGEEQGLEQKLLYYVTGLLTLVLMFLLGALVTLLFKGMKDGYNQTTGKADGAEQEKSRAGIQRQRPRAGTRKGKRKNERGNNKTGIENK